MSDPVSGPLAAPLAHGVLRIGGDDAAPWLQGQTTQDVLALRPGEGAYTLFVLPTGKVRADAFVSRTGDGFDLVVDRALLAPLADTLDRYVVMEDVTFERPELAVVTVQDAQPAHVEGLDGRPAARLGTRGYDVLVPPSALPATLETLRARGANVLDAEGYEALRVARGVPRHGVDFGEDTLPQEAGVARRAVSFTKGCYIGQEPVVMLEHRGKPPKRLCRVRGTHRPSALPAPLEREGVVVGQITSATSTPEGFVGLALVKRSAALVGATFAHSGAEVSLEGIVGETDSTIAPRPG